MNDVDREAVLADLGRRLADAVESVLAPWVVASVARRGGAMDDATTAAARDAGDRAARDVSAELRALLARDSRSQPENPLAVLRRAVRYPTEVLRGARVPPVERDEFAQARFPDDDYDLTPASFDDIDPSLHDIGLEWGAAKAFASMKRQ